MKFNVFTQKKPITTVVVVRHTKIILVYGDIKKNVNLFIKIMKVILENTN